MCGHFFDHGVGSLVAKALPIAAAFIPGVGPLASAALMAGAGALSSRLQGGSWGDALKSGALSGLGSAAAPFLGNAFASAFPQTAGALGVTGGNQTILDSLGLSDAPSMASVPGVAAAGASSGSDAGLSQGTQDFLTNLGAPESISPELAAADPSLAASSSSPSGLSALTAKVPVVGPILDKASTWAGNNPLTAAGVVLGGAQAVASVRQRQAQQKQQQAATQAAAAKDAQDSANWRLTLNTPALPRQINPALAGQDWTQYGYGPEQQMLTNNQLDYGQGMADGGRVRSDDSEPDMEPMERLRAKANYPKQTWVPADTDDYNLNRANRRINRPMTDGELDMDPVGKRRGGRIRRMAAGGLLPAGGVALPKTGIKLSPQPRGMNSPSTQVPFTSLMPKLRAMSLNSKVHKMSAPAVRVAGSGRKFAAGGAAFPRKNGKINGPGGPTGDQIPAMLSDGEYVVKAKNVSHLGSGDNDEGAGVMDIINNAPADKLRRIGKKVKQIGRTKMPPPVKTSDIMAKLATRGGN